LSFYISGESSTAFIKNIISIEIKNAAYEIISRDKKSILPVSSLMCNEYDIDNVCLSLHSIVGSNGVV